MGGLAKKRLVLPAVVLAGALATSGAALAQGHNPQFTPLYPVVGWPNIVPGCNTGFQAGLNDVYPNAYDIARDPSDVPATPLPNGATLTITAHRIEAYIAPGADGQWGGNDDEKFSYFAFGGGHGGEMAPPKVPAPFIRVTEGNTYTFKIKNYDQNHPHLVDFHAIVGHRGGPPVYGAQPATVVGGTVVPSEGCATFTFRNPGLFVYHCVGAGTPQGIAHHMNNGMAGLILVEPKAPGQAQPFKSLTTQAKEFYLFQEDVFTSRNNSGAGGVTPGVYDYDEGAMLANTSSPRHSVFNGRVGSVFDHPMIAEAGKNAVVYFGTSGGHVSSLHGIGLIWDWNFIEGDILNPYPHRNVQTSLVPSAGSLAVIMDGAELVPTELGELLACRIPPNLALFVDHASPFFRKGAIAPFAVVGNGSPGDSALCR